ncbi:MAG: hypothetical protein WCS15_04380, partial [Prevotella sp.]
TFATPPTMTFPFTADHDSYGFTLLFDDKANWYPKSVTIAAYNSSNALISSTTVTATSARLVIEMPVTNYRKIVLTFHSTQSPYQKVHLSEVIFGVVEYHDKSSVPSATILYEIDPRMKTFPAGEMVQTIDNSDGRYNMRSPNSLYAYLQTGQAFDTNEIGLGGIADALEYINMGKQFYFAKAQSNEATMTAVLTSYDLVYQMDKTTYRKGVQGTDTVSNLIDAVLTDSGRSIAANIPSGVGARVIGSNIPIVSHREAIRMICEAAHCVGFINRDNEQQLVDIVAGTSVDALDGDNMEEWPDINVDDAINTVDVSVYSYYESSFDKATIYSGTADVDGTEDVWIEYDAASSASATVTDGTLNSTTYYMRAAKLNITGSGTVTIAVTGYALSASKTAYSANNITGDETVQSYSVDNELVNSTVNAASIAAYQLGLSRITYPFIDMGNPAREMADTITVGDAYGGTGSAVVTKQKFTYDGGLKCEVEAIG